MKKYAGLMLFPLSMGALAQQSLEQPNVLIIKTDQWRAHAFGYAGDPNVITPNIDRLAGESVNFVNAVSVCPVCSPARASILTGQFPLSTRVYINDARLSPEAVTFGEAFGDAGYQTGYIGKWHVDGHARNEPIPKGRRHGFDFWKVAEANHNYNHSVYFDENNERHIWEGYDAFAQTQMAITFMQEKKKNPFLLVVSYGPPHSPYLTAPDEYQQMYDPDKLILPPNIPDWRHIDTRPNLAGYYAHCTALDDCVGDLMNGIDSLGLRDNTIVIFLSDHGEMIGSKGFYNKQVPFDESIRVPMLWRIPGRDPAKKDYPFNLTDIFPTMASLAGIPIPESVEGYNVHPYIDGADAPAKGAFIQFVEPFGKWDRSVGGREYRAIRTARYTYVKDLNGPWLLYDNLLDPYQQSNLVNHPGMNAVQKHLETLLISEMAKRNDEFLPGTEYNRRFGFVTGCGNKIIEFLEVND